MFGVLDRYIGKTIFNTIIMTLKDGEVVIELLQDIAPKHAERMKELARAKAYDNVVFHRVIDGFMAQTGDVQHANMEKGWDARRAGTGGSASSPRSAARSARRTCCRTRRRSLARSASPTVSRRPSRGPGSRRRRSCRDSCAPARTTNARTG